MTDQKKFVNIRNVPKGERWIDDNELENRRKYYQEKYVDPHLQLEKLQEEGRQKLPGIIARILQRGEEAKEKRIANETENREKWSEEDLTEGTPQLFEDLREEFGKRQPNKKKSKRARRSIVQESTYQRKKKLKPGEILSGWGRFSRQTRADYLANPNTRRMIENGIIQLFNEETYRLEDERAGIIPEPKKTKRRNR